MDGVIVDSEPILREAVGRLFAEKGVEVGPDDCQRSSALARTTKLLTLPDRLHL